MFQPLGAPERPRRFYEAVSVGERREGFAVLLDGRTVKTPAGKPLTAPTRALAEALAAEWEAQRERVEPATMPVTRLMNVALDRTPAAREAVADEVARYAGTDVVCHLADDDLELARIEEAAWAPLRDWAGQELGVALEPVAGLLARPQSEASLAAARAAALAHDDIRLTALAHATALLGSAVLALALSHGRLDARAAFAASRIDEERQAQRWGVDAEAADRADALLAELLAVERLLRAA
jgi:chaperone required for assembly of F1-ATPase